MGGWVLGCHRSGTSLLSGILRSALPEPHRGILGSDIPDSLANPFGHHESQQVCDSNEKILNWSGARWDHPFLIKPDWSCKQSIDLLTTLRPALKNHCKEDLWIDKDPRLCLTRDAWIHILLKDIPSIAIIRNPFAVAESLFRRDGFGLEKAGLIWLLYNLHLFDARSADPIAVLLFEDLVLGKSLRSSQIADDIMSFLQRACALDEQAGNTIKVETIDQLIDTQSQSTLVRNHYREDHRDNADLAHCLAETWVQVSEAVHDRCDAKDLAKIYRHTWAECSPILSRLLAEPLKSNENVLCVHNEREQNLLKRIQRRLSL